MSRQRRIAALLVGIVPIVGMALLLGFLVGPLGGNEAKSSLRPITHAIEDAGGTQICKNGDGGHFINRQPWFQVVYSVPDDGGVRQEVIDKGSAMGFPLKKITEPSRLVGNVNDYSSADDFSDEGLYLSVSQGETFSVSCADGEREMSAVDGAAVYSLSMVLPSGEQ